MALGDGMRDIFLAGIGAMAITGDKAKEIVDKLIEQGEITVEQGKEINKELTHKATTAATQIEDSAIEERLKHMSAEEREAFAARVSGIVDKINAEKAEDDGDVEVVEEEK